MTIRLRGVEGTMRGFSYGGVIVHTKAGIRIQYSRVGRTRTGQEAVQQYWLVNIRSVCLVTETTVSTVLIPAFVNMFQQNIALY